MKIENKIIVLCQAVTTDANDGLNTLFKILNGFRVGFDFESYKKSTGNEIDGTPVPVPLPHALSTMWRSDKKLTSNTDLECKITLHGPKGTIGDPIITPVTIKSEDENFWVHANIGGINIMGSGLYKYVVEILLDGKKLNQAEYEFKVDVINDKNLNPAA